MRLAGLFSIAMIALAVLALPPVASAQQDDGGPLVLPDSPGTPVAPIGPFDASLTTLFAANNGFAGNMFDLVSDKPVTIVGFDTNLSVPGSTNTVEVYWRTGTVAGAENSAAGWTLMGTDANVISAGADNPSPVDVGGLTMTPGQVYGIYVNVASYPSAGMRYTNGGPTVYSNADLQLTTYFGKGNPAFTGRTFSPRRWNGTVYYNLGSGPVQTIYAGIRGGGLQDIDDDPDRTIKSWKDGQLAKRINRVVPFCADRSGGCNPQSNSHIGKIRDYEGGIDALGYFMTGQPGHSIVTTPGNSKVSRNFVVEWYQPGTRVFTAGFSAGGGDIQNLLTKLDKLSIPVECSGHIDSVEVFGSDRRIPANTTAAKGFYQKQSQRYLRGEDKLYAADSSTTTVSNRLITDPVGPATGGRARFHRNMDNDSRPTTSIKRCFEDAISRAPGAAQAGVCEEGGCGASSSMSLESQVEGLGRQLASAAGPEAIFWSRSTLSKSITTPRKYREILDLYYKSGPDDRLRENLAAVILRIDTSRLLRAATKAALETGDYDLFSSITYSLGRSETGPAKLALLRTAANPQLSGYPGMVQDAVLNAFSRSGFSLRDAERVAARMTTSQLSDFQLDTLSRAVKRYGSREAVEVLAAQIIPAVSDPALRLAISARLNR